MSTKFRPFFYADERNGQPIIENCVAASGVNLARAATNGAIPSTDAEVMALRAATGDLHGGQTLQQLRFGMFRRYGFAGPITTSWTALTQGFNGPAWFASLGWLHKLPKRNWTQPSDVFHCIAVTGDGPGHVIIADPLQRPRPVAQRMTIAEFRPFAQSGGYDALRIDEYSAVPHVSVNCAHRWNSTLIYERPSPTTWKRHRAFGVKFSGTCTTAVPMMVLGKSRRMVRMTSGSHAPDTWLALDAAHITYAEGE